MARPTMCRATANLDLADAIDVPDPMDLIDLIGVTDVPGAVDVMAENRRREKILDEFAPPVCDAGLGPTFVNLNRFQRF